MSSDGVLKDRTHQTQRGSDPQSGVIS